MQCGEHCERVTNGGAPALPAVKPDDRESGLVMLAEMFLSRFIKLDYVYCIGGKSNGEDHKIGQLSAGGYDGRKSVFDRAVHGERGKPRRL